ncbi:DUF2975 domain-containing protein [Paenibacillus gansuensis]|uniref:DUF2975 domain-containing protein n=1 Tax=Paenibacillus gansuensis TaxID=306542 RepID=A0ABW5PJE7_9BACL
MERGSTLFLKAAVVVIGLPILALCILALPEGIKDSLGDPYPFNLVVPIIIGLYLAVIPFYAALYQAFKLLGYIDKGVAFSDLSVTALKKIKFCAFVISGIFVACLPLLFLIADEDDAPGLIVMGMVLVFASAVIGVFAALLQKLLRHAIDIKSENDLTV